MNQDKAQRLLDRVNGLSKVFVDDGDCINCRSCIIVPIDSIT